MHCIICRLEKPPRAGVGEHTIPLSVGGSWTIDRVCQDCDNDFGTRHDAGLVKLTSIEMRRIALGLEGHSGSVPNREREALARPVRVIGTSRYMNVSTDRAGRPTRKHSIPFADFVVLLDPNGNWSVSLPPDNVAIDPADMPKAHRILERRLRDAFSQKGLTVPDEEVKRLVAHFVVSLERVEEDTTVELRVPVRTTGHLPGLLKIAYETTWHLLGDSWLDDPVAVNMNRYLRGDETAPVRIYAEKVPVRFDLQGLNPSDAHVIMLHRLPSGSGAIYIRLFDTVEADFIVTDDLAQYRVSRRHALVMDAASRAFAFVSPREILKIP